MAQPRKVDLSGLDVRGLALALEVQLLELKLRWAYAQPRGLDSIQGLDTNPDFLAWYHELGPALAPPERRQP